MKKKMMLPETQEVDLLNLYEKLSELDFVHMFSFDRTCHGCNDKAECTCFYENEGDDMFKPWRIVCYAKELLSDGIPLKTGISKENQKVIDLCDIFAASRRDLYRDLQEGKRGKKGKKTKQLTEEEVMDFVKQTLESQSQANSSDVNRVEKSGSDDDIDEEQDYRETPRKKVRKK